MPPVAPSNVLVGPILHPLHPQGAKARLERDSPRSTVQEKYKSLSDPLASIHSDRLLQMKVIEIEPLEMIITPNQSAPRLHRVQGMGQRPHFAEFRMENNMSDDNQKQQKELSPEELDKVAGGRDDGGAGNTSGGQKDPLQQFQQILQQLK